MEELTVQQKMENARKEKRRLIGAIILAKPQYALMMSVLQSKTLKQLRRIHEEVGH